MQHPPRIQARDDTRNSPAVGLLRISPAMLSLRLYPRLERLGWGGVFATSHHTVTAAIGHQPGDNNISDVYA